MTLYNREAVVRYAKKYGITPNPAYPYYEGDDCTNFVSQCLQAGGCKNHFDSTHPWWCVGKNTSVCWSVASSLYWYIKVCTERNQFGIKAKTVVIKGHNYTDEIAKMLKVGDVIQYINFKNRIQHTAIVTGFYYNNGRLEPLISQHTFNAVNVSWRHKKLKETIFHHILAINDEHL